MTFILGVDTGGSYTDAAICDGRTRAVVGWAKAPTTHDQLEVGIGGAIDAALARAGIRHDQIGLVSLSTTLATNALVENKARRAALVMVGFDEAALARGGLRAGLADTEVLRCAGGHTSHGQELEPLDTDALRPLLHGLAQRVDAVAVASQFSVRNPSHEIAVRDLVRDCTGLPVTCSHELSTALNGPKRALTALLNARLIALIDDLVRAAADLLLSRGIDAPLMIVRGNGSLVSLDFVRDRPIETILSGPAASLIGAGHLTDVSDAIIADMGGTTTDIAVLVDGLPQLSPAGAVVGGHETMVQAVRLHTHGLGGDSEVGVADRASGSQLTIGPRRIVPLARTALEAPDIVAAMLARQLRADFSAPYDALLVAPTAHARTARQLSRGELAVLDALAGALCPVDEVVRSSVQEQALRRLVTQGLVQLSGFTPTDACHVLGLQTDLDAQAAHDGATLFARRRGSSGEPVATDATALSRDVVTAVSRRSAEAVLEAALDRDDIAVDTATAQLVRAALDRSSVSARVNIGVAVPLVGLGAPAPTYYPAVAELLGTTVQLPPGVEVANAIGAAVAPVKASRSVTVSAPRRGIYRVHGGDPPVTLSDLVEARALAQDCARALAETEARDSGGCDLTFEIEWNERSVTINGRSLFVEGVATATATGHPLTMVR